MSVLNLAILANLHFPGGRPSVLFLACPLSEKLPPLAAAFLSGLRPDSAKYANLTSKPS